jgi:hypothetical protein
MVRPPSCTIENEAHGVLDRNLIMEMVGSILERPYESSLEGVNRLNLKFSIKTSKQSENTSSTIAGQFNNY